MNQSDRQYINSQESVAEYTYTLQNIWKPCIRVHDIKY